jgi:C-terminal processing protease CtpA/Prc
MQSHDRKGVVRLVLTHESGWPVPPEKPYFNARRVFLTDGRAISYAETVMGIVEAFKLGEIVGGPTAGTNGNVNPFRLPGGYTIPWTGMKVLKHDGSQHHGIGILPTVAAARTRKGVAAGRDEILLRGLEVVRKARTN